VISTPFFLCHTFWTRLARTPSSFFLLRPRFLVSLATHRRISSHRSPQCSISLMERSATEYTQSGLPSPYPSNFGDNNSEGSTADQPSAAAAAQYPVKPEYNPTSANSTATPTSEYGVYPPSARSGSFPEHIRGSYPGTSASGGSMAQQQNSPSMPQQDGRNHQPHGVRSDNDVPIDPSIAAASPTYPYPQHSPYGPNPDMAHAAGLGGLRWSWRISIDSRTHVQLPRQCTTAAA
jgi:hypothetical protein